MIAPALDGVHQLQCQRNPGYIEIAEQFNEPRLTGDAEGAATFVARSTHSVRAVPPHASSDASRQAQEPGDPDGSHGNRHASGEAEIHVLDR